MSSFHAGFERATPNDDVLPVLMSVAVELLRIIPQKEQLHIYQFDREKKQLHGKTYSNQETTLDQWILHPLLEADAKYCQ